MSCNGFGHPPWCDCGWGGKFYQPLASQIYGLKWNCERSHTKPNATCPVCGAGVFFYRSPDNGSVFFDELGPPWPKHRCTDQENDRRSHLSTKPRKRGWWPFLLDVGFPLPASEGVCLIDTHERALIVKTSIKNFRIDTPVWISAKVGHKGEYMVSTLRTKKGRTNEVTFHALNFSLLSHLKYAKDFQNTVKLVNATSRKNNEEQ